eukprot:TRINITY_DN8480_c0_g1_i1.p1 TRINITY_DN8480_c0_g1~~TRINITY_DN8480_c0_g1_i1.p1  ORF type:complete len:1017 (+),score=260.84 TRINITY_DN8480_c0_g1_i1:58-3108(+)
MPMEHKYRTIHLKEDFTGQASVLQCTSSDALCLCLRTSLLVSLSASKSTAFSSIFTTDSFDKLSDGEKKQLNAVRFSLSTVTPTPAFHVSLTDRSFRCLAPSPFLPFSRTVCNAVAYGEMGMGLVRMNEDGMQRKRGEMELIFDLGRIWMDYYGEMVSSMLKDMRDGSPDQLRKHLIAMWGKDGIKRWEKRGKCEEVFTKSIVELSSRRRPADRPVKIASRIVENDDNVDVDDDERPSGEDKKRSRRPKSAPSKSKPKPQSLRRKEKGVKFKQERTSFTREIWLEFLNIYLSSCEEAVANGDLESIRAVPETADDIPKERFQHNAVEIAIVGATARRVFEAHLDECEKFGWKEKQFNNEMARRLRLYYRTPLQPELKEQEKKPFRKKHYTGGSTLFEMHFQANRFIQLEFSPLIQRRSSASCLLFAVTGLSHIVTMEITDSICDNDDICATRIAANVIDAQLFVGENGARICRISLIRMFRDAEKGSWEILLVAGWDDGSVSLLRMSVDNDVDGASVSCSESLQTCGQHSLDGIFNEYAGGIHHIRCEHPYVTIACGCRFAVCRLVQGDHPHDSPPSLQLVWKCDGIGEPPQFITSVEMMRSNKRSSSSKTDGAIPFETSSFVVFVLAQSGHWKMCFFNASSRFISEPFRIQDGILDQDGKGWIALTTAQSPHQIITHIVCGRPMSHVAVHSYVPMADDMDHLEGAILHCAWSSRLSGWITQDDLIVLCDRMLHSRSIREALIAKLLPSGGEVSSSRCEFWVLEDGISPETMHFRQRIVQTVYNIFHKRVHRAARMRKDEEIRGGGTDDGDVRDLTEEEEDKSILSILTKSLLLVHVLCSLHQFHERIDIANASELSDAEKLSALSMMDWLVLYIHENMRMLNDQSSFKDNIVSLIKRGYEVLSDSSGIELASTICDEGISFEVSSMPLRSVENGKGLDMQVAMTIDLNADAFGLVWKRCPLTFLIVLDQDALICPVTGAPIKRVKPSLVNGDHMFRMMLMPFTFRPVHPLCGATL